MKQAESGQELNTVATLQKPQLARSWIVRWICIVLAWLCLGLGTVGIIVPGVPTFDFYFLAALFAAKGSARLHGWIVNNRVIAPILKQWQTQRSLPLKVKILSLMSMSFAAVLMVITIPHPWAVGTLIVFMICAQVWMWFKT
jgi:uncharacterized membrane protein YbaN (DUF454 family)